MGSVEIDSAMRTVRRDGQPVHLRARSFATLLCLIENRGAVVTKEILLDTFWKDTNVTENALVQSIKDIRQALGDDPKNPCYLRTVPKTGYSFIAAVEVYAAVEEHVSTAPAAESGTAVRGRPRLAVTRGMGLAAGLLALLAIATTIGFVRRGQARNGTRAETAWWKFDEGHGTVAYDSSGSGMQGSLNGNPRWTEGKLGQALLLDGFATFASGRQLDGLPLGNAARTIAVWVKPDVNLVDDSGIFQYGTAGPVPRGANFILALTRRGNVSLGSAVYSGTVESSNTVTDGEWHHVVGAWDGEAARIFIDGALDAAGKPAVKPATGDSSGWTIGRYLHDGTPFRGAIDDVRAYRRALQPQEVQALYRCSAREPDIVLAGVSHYFLPVFNDGPIVDRKTREIRNAGTDFSGVQFARSDGVCAAESLRGAETGQNLRIQVELMVPSDPAGHYTEAGPYFRSRRAYAGEGLIGGTSAGYFVQLDSRGMVKVRRLYPQAVVAFSSAPAAFDPAIFHSLEVVAQGEVLRVRLDHIELSFDQGGRLTGSVAIPAEWEKSTPRGKNAGAAGIAFLSEDRSRIGGQRARNIAVTVF